MRRIPGSPKELSVLFCNMHGKPSKLPRVSQPRTATKKSGISSTTKVFENRRSVFSCFTGDIKSLCTSEPPLSEVVSGIITDVVNKVVTVGDDINIEAAQYPDNESLCSLDHSLITNSFGDPYQNSLN